MEISLDENRIQAPEDWNTNKNLIKVIGVGGGGCNAVTEMFRQKIHDVDFLICNTDKQSLEQSEVPEKIKLGNKGLGAGCNPENGRRAANESLDKIKKALSDASEMVFITAGMGGGTGTGAAPVIAQVAKEMGKLTVGIVTLPFRDEGKEFVKRAIKGIRELKKHVDSLLIIDNQKLYQVFGDLNIYEAFPKADEVLSNAVKSIAEIITRPGFINVDFADVKMVMKNSGMAIMGTGTASGPDRASKAVEMAFESPLLNDCDLNTAKGVLVNITSSKQQGPTMSELAQIMEYVNNFTGNASAFKRGVVIDENMGEKISVTVVATGFNVSNLPQIGLEDEGEGGRIIFGESGIYGSENITGPTTRVVIDNMPEENDIMGANNMETGNTGADSIYEDSMGGENEYAAAEIHTAPAHKEKHIAAAPQTYVKRTGKPALILEPHDDIVKLEIVPAYMRRNQKLQAQIAQSQQESGDMKIDQINGSHHLTSNNSYLHQTQD